MDSEVRRRTFSAAPHPAAATAASAPASPARPAAPPEVRAPFTASTRRASAREKVQAYLGQLAPQAKDVKLRTVEETYAALERLQAKGVDVRTIGESREGRPIQAMRIGEGPLHVVAISGAHPDEPVGCATLLHLFDRLKSDPALVPLLKEVTFDVVPMANPDGTKRNERWFQGWTKSPDIREYLRHVHRDVPADDVEFGFPSSPDDNARPENAAIARWFDSLGKIDHYASLHSMFLGGGALYLVTTDDVPAHAPQLSFLVDQAQAVGIELHDKDRFGQKGFSRIGPGLHTAPTAEAMREFFSNGKADDVAARFKLNSMQYVQRFNDCPLAFVTEMPLVFDPALSSMEELPHSRAEEELRLADGLETCIAEASAYASRLADAVVGVPEAEAKVATLKRRIAAGQATVNAQRADTARYGDARATKGNVLETDLQLRRRRAALLSMARGVVAELPAEKVGALAAELDQKLASELDGIANDFDIQHPRLEAQVQAQLAALLAALLK